MHVRLATELDRKGWDEFVSSSPYPSFLQSWTWGQMHRELATSFWRLVVEDAGRLAGVALVIKRPLPLGRCWLYIPRGPVLGHNKQAWQMLLARVVALAKEQQAIFVRIDPAIPEDEQPFFIKTAPDSLLFRKSEREVQPRHTLIIDLTKSEAELLADMHPKTRYNIGLAKRKGVTICLASRPADIEAFLQLTRHVARRSGFRYHPDQYYRAMGKVLGQVGMFELGLADYQGEILAAHIVLSFGSTATYAHGASSSARRGLMAPHLLFWEQIRHAKGAGLRSFDLFGVAPPGAGPDHPWAGITRLKTSLGGARVNYLGAYDLIFDSGMYQLFNVARRVRGILR